MSRAEDLQGAGAVVTGGSSGIGAAVVALLGSAGARVVVVDLQDTAAPVEAALRCDVADEAQVVAAVAQASDLLGGIDV
ncbi:MAG TPA: SDR family NAD(P)-dependent oxidoreductase, partial [Acidimicrobiales bacterium]|nr:SDR family NAD(P)-dependent oxidoreductase [Acidimicrobiales bacterium]